IFANLLRARRPAHVDTRSTTVDPAQFLQLVQERRDSGSAFRVAGCGTHEHSDAPRPLALLRARREGPRRRAAEQRDELATPDHSITSSARASSDGGTVRPSALAVVRLMTRSNFIGCSTGMSPGLAPRRILST